MPPLYGRTCALLMVIVYGMVRTGLINTYPREWHRCFGARTRSPCAHFEGGGRGEEIAALVSSSSEEEQ